MRIVGGVFWWATFENPPVFCVPSNLIDRSGCDPAVWRNGLSFFVCLFVLFIILIIIIIINKVKRKDPDAHRPFATHVIDCIGLCGWSRPLSCLFIIIIIIIIIMKSKAVKNADARRDYRLCGLVPTVQ
jgi:preprotein translocase subunit SecG